jgi:hypothetical protein
VIRWSLAVLAVAACSGDKEPGQPAPAPADERPRVAELADEGCACANLGCIDQVQQTLVRIGERQHGSAEATRATEAARERLDACTARLAKALLSSIAELTDELCACPDRPCYDALRPKVNSLFSRSNAAAVPPPILAEIQREVARFNRCDERFSSP